MKTLESLTFWGFQRAAEWLEAHPTFLQPLFQHQTLAGVFKFRGEPGVLEELQVAEAGEVFGRHEDVGGDVGYVVFEQMGEGAQVWERRHGDGADV